MSVRATAQPHAWPGDFDTVLTAIGPALVERHGVDRCRWRALGLVDGHVAALSDDAGFAWVDRVLLDLYFALDRGEPRGEHGRRGSGSARRPISIKPLIGSGSSEEASTRWARLEALGAERGWTDRLMVALEQACSRVRTARPTSARPGVSAPSASNDLRRLVDAGLLEQRGRGRATSYVATAQLRGVVT